MMAGCEGLRLACVAAGAVRARLTQNDSINLVDVAFADVPAVRDARRLFIEATSQESENPVVIVERYHSLIGAVATTLDMGHQITGSDIRMGYYPVGAGKLDEAAIAEAEEKIARRETAKMGAKGQGQHPSKIG